jgi:cysteine-rich repeat protein
LANLTQKDPWFNLPHRADDEYVKRYAEYLRDNLNPDLTIYLEYSNEVWNDAYIQSAWLRQKGCADTDTFIPFEGSKDSGVIGCDDFASGIKATAKRMVQIFDIFNHVFGDDSQRVVKIIGGNTQWYEYNDWLWGHFNDPIINPEGIKADAIAIAPYFARSQNISEIIQNESGEALTVDSILNFAADDLQTTVNSWFIHYGNWAQERNLQLLAYEGGNLLTYTERGPELAKKVEDASQHPRMGELYLEYFDQWRQAGGDLIMVNNYVGLPGYGATQGILEYQNQPLNEDYMYQAVMTAAGKNHKATVCGDGVAQTWEACDDGNTKDGDGCSKYCVIE